MFLPSLHSCLEIRGFPKIRFSGVWGLGFWRGPYNKGYGILRPKLGPPIWGKYHQASRDWSFSASRPPKQVLKSPRTCFSRSRISSSFCFIWASGHDGVRVLGMDFWTSASILCRGNEPKGECTRHHGAT